VYLAMSRKTNHCVWKAKLRDKAWWTTGWCGICPFYLPYLSAEEGLVILTNQLGDLRRVLPWDISV